MEWSFSWFLQSILLKLRFSQVNSIYQLWLFRKWKQLARGASTLLIIADKIVNSAALNKSVYRLFPGVLSTFHTIGSHMYMFSHNQKFPFSDAQSMCTRTGGYLLEINDAEEQKQFERIFMDIIKKYSNAS